MLKIRIKMKKKKLKNPSYFKTKTINNNDEI